MNVILNVTDGYQRTTVTAFLMFPEQRAADTVQQTSILAF